MKKTELKQLIREILNEVDISNSINESFGGKALQIWAFKHKKTNLYDANTKSIIAFYSNLKFSDDKILDIIKNGSKSKYTKLDLSGKDISSLGKLKPVGGIINIKRPISLNSEAINEVDIKLPKKGITLSSIETPNVKDWIVYTEDHPALFFSGKESRDDVRGAYAQHEKVKFQNVRVSRMTPEALKTQFKQEEDETVSLIAAKRIVSNGPIRDTVAKMIGIEGYNGMDAVEKKNAVIEALSKFSKKSFLAHDVYKSSRTYQAKQWVEKPEKIKPRKGLELDHEIKEMIRAEIKNLLKENRSIKMTAEEKLRLAKIDKLAAAGKQMMKELGI